MQACNGCKGIIDPVSPYPHYCSFCVTRGRRSRVCSYCGAQYLLQNGSINMCGKCLMKHMQGTNPCLTREQQLRKEERLQIEALTRLELIIDRLKRIKEYKNEPRISDIINEPDILAFDKILDMLKDKLR